MRRRHVRRAATAGATLAVLAATMLPAGAADAPRAAQHGVRGDFSLIMMVHTRSSSFGDLPGVNPWWGQRGSTQTYKYRSIPCTGNAPVNNIASDLPSYNARVSGSRVPSSMRAHPMAFKVVKTSRGWRMRGILKFTVCKMGPGPAPSDDPVPDEKKPKIRMSFIASFYRVNDETLRYSGSVRLLGGTKRYEDLRGSGRIAGYLFCFAPEGCRPHKKYLDGQMVIHGTYADPTPQLTRPGL